MAVADESVRALATTLESAAAVGRDEVAGVERLARRVESVRLALIARVERDRVAARSGSSNTAAWVSEATRSGGGVAAGQVALATALESELPATRAALAAGEVSARHAGIIAGAMRGLPVELSGAERAKVEASLVRDARRLEPARLRQAATMALAAVGKSVAEAAAHQERVLADQERRAYAASRLTLFDQGDGTTSGRFVVPTGTAMVLRKVLQSMTAPRRDAQRATSSAGAAGGGSARDQGDQGDQGVQGVEGGQTGRGAEGVEGVMGAAGGHGVMGGDGAEGDPSVAEAMRARNADWDSLDWHEKQGRAFVDLLEHLPTDRLTGRVASTIVVTMTAEQAFSAAALVRGESGGLAGHAATTHGSGSDARFGPDVGAARCDTGHLHSTSEARRLACNAGILPAVLGGPSLPLDLGREQRLFSHHQRTALAAVYDECAALGCDRPFAWSELHHLTPWSAGGKTNLSEALPLCGFHHRRIHDPAYTHHLHATATGLKTVRFSLRQ